MDDDKPGMMMVISNVDGTKDECFVPIREELVRTIYDTLDMVVTTIGDVNVLESSYACLLWVNYQLRCLEKRIGVTTNGDILASLGTRAYDKIDDLMQAIEATENGVDN